MNLRKAKRRVIRGLLGLAGAALAGIVLFVAVAFVTPFPRAMLARYPAATVLLDREGQPLRVRLGAGDLDARGTYRPDRADWIAQAIVAAEDRRFWSHPGVDPLALVRAAFQNLGARRVVSGASTLSTQVIRLCEPRRRTPLAKLIEAFRALQLERIVSKAEILAQYLRRAPFGSNLVGIEAASRRYFGKAPGDLSLAEAALLAGLPQNPSRLRPDRFPDRARARQAYVLERMQACGFITDDQRRAAAAQPLAVRRVAYPFAAPHFCELALDRLSGAGGAVRTTLDPALQRVVEEALRRRRASLESDGIRSAAIVVLEVESGVVRALAGSFDYRAAAAGQVNGACAARSAGSTLKPFAFALAFDEGWLTPRAILADVPRTFGDYSPDNFDGEFLGPVTARDALVLSLNLPALDVVRRLGVPTFLRALRRAGLNDLRRPASDYGLGLALGNGEVQLLDLVNAYAALARGGEWKPYRLLEAETRGEARRICSAEAAWLVADILGGDERAMDATGHSADVRLPRLAWKTGTSSGLRDAWVVGFNPDYVVGVWAGNPDGAPAPRLAGSRSAMPLAWDVWREMYPDNVGPWFLPPPGVRTTAVCAISGRIGGPYCRQIAEDRWIAGATLHETCRIHREPPGPDGAVRDVWPAEIAAFLDRQRRRSADCGRPAAASAVRILAPADGSVFRRSDGLAEPIQQLTLRATSGESGSPLYWFVNGVCLGRAEPGETLRWPLAAGRHQLVCADTSGHSDRVRIVVE